MVSSPSVSDGPAGGGAGVGVRVGGARTRTGAGGARFVSGGFFWATRAGRCFGTGTLMVGSEVAGLGAGAGAVLWAHTLHGTSNDATLTHTRRMNFPAEFMAGARETWANCLPMAPA